MYINNKLLAFILLYKRRVKNSIVPTNNLNKKKLAKRLEISIKTLNKYLQLTSEKGLLKQRGKALQIVSINECIITLFDFADDQHFYFRVFRTRKREFILSYKAKLKDFLALINQELARLQFSTQNHSNTETIINHRIKRAVDLSADRNVNVAVTGCYHLSKIVGCSSSTATRLLIKWNKENLINRKINELPKKFIDFTLLTERLKKFALSYSYFKTLCIGSIINDFSKLGSENKNFKYIGYKKELMVVQTNRYYLNPNW